MIALFWLIQPKLYFAMALKMLCFHRLEWCFPSVIFIVIFVSVGKVLQDKGSCCFSSLWAGPRTRARTGRHRDSGGSDSGIGLVRQAMLQGDEKTTTRPRCIQLRLCGVGRRRVVDLPQPVFIPPRPSMQVELAEHGALGHLHPRSIPSSRRSTNHR